MLTYLRNKYQCVLSFSSSSSFLEPDLLCSNLARSYCFWCGTQYDDEKDLEENCPGTEEDDH